MTDQEPSRFEAVRRQLLAHLRGLHSAGIDWLPIPAPGSPPAFASVAEDRTKATAPALAEPALAEPALAAPKPATQEPPVLHTLPTPSLLDLMEKRAIGVSELSLEERRTALGVLAKEVSGCTRCAELCSTRLQTVFGQGEPGVEVCFVGEAPGGEEDLQGIPFVGPAGQLLNLILAASGLKRAEVYICNIIKCRPPGNRTPLPSEAGNCRAYLERQIELVQPKYLVALGGCAAANLLSTSQSLGKLRGRFHAYKGIPVMVTYHPSYLLPHRNPEKKKEVWADMRWFMQQLGRPVPQKR